jgi:hypothetical protein
MRKRMLLGMVFVCGMAGTVQAATLTSGPVFGGPDQTHVACVVVNLSNAPITFLKTQLIGHFRGVLPQFFNGCGTTLARNGMCSFQANADRESTACKVIIAQAKTNVRGTMVALTGDVNEPFPLSESDLR